MKPSLALSKASFPAGWAQVVLDTRLASIGLTPFQQDQQINRFHKINRSNRSDEFSGNCAVGWHQRE
jgi:hypothetical protein